MQVDSKADEAELRVKRLQAATLPPAIKIGWGPLILLYYDLEIGGKGVSGGNYRYTVIGRLFVYF